MFGWLTRWFRRGTSPELVECLPDKSVIYKPLIKYYIFNETGNVMLCTSDKKISGFDEDLRNSFMDVTVFFAAMSKAIHTTNNPHTGKPFSIYNYQAVKSILQASGMFIEVNVEEAVFNSFQVGDAMTRDFLQYALNRNFGEATLPFSRAMFNGMRFQHNQLPKDVESKGPDVSIYFRGGSVFFICEILMGIPQISAALIRIEPQSVDSEESIRAARKRQLDDHCNIFDVGADPHLNRQSTGFTRQWRFKKRTFLFVPPKFLSSNSSQLLRGNYPEMEALIDRLRDALKKTAVSEKV